MPTKSKPQPVDNPAIATVADERPAGSAVVAADPLVTVAAIDEPAAPAEVDKPLEVLALAAAPAAAIASDKPVAPAKRGYRVASHLTHDREYAIDETVWLEDRHAKPLLERGIVTAARPSTEA